MRNLDRIQAAYESGEGCLKKLAEQFDIPYSTLTRRCFDEEWRKPRTRRALAKMSVNAYAYVHGLWLTHRELDALCGRAQMRCLARNIQREIKNDDRFGTVFTYPVDILASIFDELKCRSPRNSRDGEEGK